MADRTRRELGRSFRSLAGGERSLFGGLVVVAVAYPVWVAGTGIAATSILDAAVGGVSTDPWSGEASALAAALAILWVIAPAAATVRFFDRVLGNVSGNLEQRYRLGTPSLLLVPPILALVAVAGVTVALGAANGWAALAVGLASGLLLVRTVAFGYRVFALSRPVLLRAMVFLAASAAALAAATRVAPRVEQGAIVAGAVDRAGVADAVYGTATYGGVTVATLPVAAALVPALLAVSYLLAHGLAALSVRVREPDVPRSEIRPGQRYPDEVRPADAGAARTAANSADSGRSGRGSTPSVGDGSTAAGTAESSPANPTVTAEAGTDGAAGSETESDDEETVGHTRVFTPPDDLDDAPDGFDEAPAPEGGAADPLAESSPDQGGAAGCSASESERGTEPAGESVEPIDSETEGALAGGSAGSSDAPSADSPRADDGGTDRCPICDARHAPDAVKCPNCNARLD